VRKILLLSLIAFIIYIFFLEPSIIVKIERLNFSMNIINEVKAVHISDLHMNKYYFFHDIILKKIKDLNPDFILYTGDSIKKNTNQESLNKFFKKLSEISDIYIVHGNWDYFDLIKVNTAYNQKKIYVTDNNSYQLYVGEQRILITGLPMYYSLRNYEYDEKAINIYLTHVPENIYNNQKTFDYADLILAGHNHGGQFFIPKLTEFIMKQKNENLKFMRGLYYVEEVPFYINRGLGSWYNLRFNATPEITLINFIPED
jgi:hypothetical protein